VKHLLFGVTAIIFISATIASAQTDSSAPPTARTSSRTSADETFDLNITERRITEHDFAASTTVEVGEETASGLMLRVGVAVGAEEINLLLRNVRGQVRFRATLDRVLERLGARRAPGAVP
jgi:hypothetical protein